MGPNASIVLQKRFHAFFPGFLICAIISAAALYLENAAFLPAMLSSLLIGMALGRIVIPANTDTGVNFLRGPLLRVAIALLGLQLGAETLKSFGYVWPAIVVAIVALTILFGIAGARLLGRGWRLGVLTGGAVAICGVAAALAIAAVLPKNEFSERNLSFTIIGAITLSTVAMIAYPFLGGLLELDDLSMGMFLGGSIHDVAQAVGAGFSVSEQVGEIATASKMSRVAMLGPVILLIALIVGGTQNSTNSVATFVPPFVVAFFCLSILNILGLVPAVVSDAAGQISRHILLLSIAAAGMRASAQEISSIGPEAIILMITETLFITALMIAFLLLFYEQAQ